MGVFPMLKEFLLMPGRKLVMQLPPVLLALRVCKFVGTNGVVVSLAESWSVLPHGLRDALMNAKETPESNGNIR